MITDFKNRIIRSFSRASLTYHDSAKIQSNIAHDLIKLAPDLSSDAQIIDIGCGTGFLSELLRDKYPQAHLTCCDISAEMLLQAQKILQNDNVTYLECDAEHHQFAHKFDLIASNMSLQWFFDLEATLKNYKNFLKEDGNILFSTLVGKTFFEWYDSLTLAGATFAAPIQEQDVPQNFPYKIIERQIKTETFPSGIDFLKMLKRIGAQSSMYDRQISQTHLHEACRIFQDKYDNTITYDVALILL